MKTTTRAGALLRSASETVLPVVSGNWKSGARVPSGSIVELTATMNGMWNESERLSIENPDHPESRRHSCLLYRRHSCRRSLASQSAAKPHPAQLVLFSFLVTQPCVLNHSTLMKSPTSLTPTTRREFLKTSGAVMAGAALAGALARPGYTAENNTIKIALIGCGGRGTGAAAQALSTSGPTRLWAMADVFDYRLQSSLAGISKAHEKQIDVQPDRQFIGLDAF